MQGNLNLVTCESDLIESALWMAREMSLDVAQRSLALVQHSHRLKPHLPRRDRLLESPFTLLCRRRFFPLLVKCL